MLYSLSYFINNSFESNQTHTLDPKHLQAFHPYVWTYNGFPHDTFAVHFVMRNQMLCFGVQIVFIVTAVIALIFFSTLAYLFLVEGKTLSSIQREHEAEYEDLMNKIERTHAEAKGLVGLRNEESTPTVESKKD